MTVASFFSGAGGMDLGFVQAGFEIAFANDNWKGVQKTYQANLGPLNTNDIRYLCPEDIPAVGGFVGGPPCQAWSAAGAMRGFGDPRGKVFRKYVALIEEKRPLFFVAENVAGLLSPRNQAIVAGLKARLDEYVIKVFLLNAVDYGLPQRRNRVFVIGFHQSLGLRPARPPALDGSPVLSSLESRLGQPEPRYKGGVSSRFLSRQRVAGWDEASYTIVATQRQIPLHPESGKMRKTESGFEVQPGSRRFSVPECAAIQGFPENFIFHYNTVADGYKMVGNAVPPPLANAVAKQIASQFIALWQKKKKRPC